MCMFVWMCGCDLVCRQCVYVMHIGGVAISNILKVSIGEHVELLLCMEG